ncbi:MAG: ABC transporter permease, partial [Verrucomicrobiota bacterium]
MNPFRGFNAIVYKEFLVVLRDPFTLFFMFFPPLIEMVAFGYALDTDVKRLRTAVLDEDRTVESRQLVDRFQNTETFRVVEWVDSVAGMDETVRQGRAYVGIQVPPGFTRELREGRACRV